MCFVRRPGAYLPHSLQAKHETNIASGIVSRGPARQATGATSGRFVIARGVGPAIDVDDPFLKTIGAVWVLGPGSSDVTVFLPWEPIERSSPINRVSRC